jgi:DNA polymerase (family 10)
VAEETNTALEVDAHYNRLDLKDDYIRMAIQNNIKLVIDSDAHHPLHFASRSDSELNVIPHIQPRRAY